MWPTNLVAQRLCDPLLCATRVTSLAHRQSAPQRVVHGMAVRRLRRGSGNGRGCSILVLVLCDCWYLLFRQVNDVDVLRGHDLPPGPRIIDWQQVQVIAANRPRACPSIERNPG